MIICRASGATPAKGGGVTPGETAGVVRREIVGVTPDDDAPASGGGVSVLGVGVSAHIGDAPVPGDGSPAPGGDAPVFDDEIIQHLVEVLRLLAMKYPPP